MLAGVLAGCGSQAAKPASTPRPTQAPRSIARVQIASDATVGGLEAAASLLQSGASLLQSAYAAQQAALTQSVGPNLEDAHRRFDAGALVLDGLAGTPDAGATANLLEESHSLFAQADDEMLAHSGASQSDAARAMTLLQKAERQLNVSPNAAATATVAARAAALKHAMLLSTPPPPKAKKHRAPVQHHHILHHATPIPSPTPTPKPVTTPTVIFRVVVAGPKHKRHSAKHRAKPHHRKPASKHTLHATATPKPAPPKPSPTPAPPTATPRPTPTHVPVVSVASARFNALLAQAVSNASAASTTLKLCSGDLDSLGTGNDPLGASQIVSCVKTAASQLHLLKSLTRPTARQLRSLARSVDSVRRERVTAHGYLNSVRDDLRAANLAAATADLTSAQTHVDALSTLLSSVQQRLAALK